MTSRVESSHDLESLISLLSSRMTWPTACRVVSTPLRQKLKRICRLFLHRPVTAVVHATGVERDTKNSLISVPALPSLLCGNCVSDQNAEDDISIEDSPGKLPPYLSSPSGWIDARSYKDH